MRSSDQKPSKILAKSAITHSISIPAQHWQLRDLLHSYKNYLIYTDGHYINRYCPKTRNLAVLAKSSFTVNALCVCDGIVCFGGEDGRLGLFRIDDNCQTVTLGSGYDDFYSSSDYSRARFAQECHNNVSIAQNRVAGCFSQGNRRNSRNSARYFLGEHTPDNCEVSDSGFHLNDSRLMDNSALSNHNSYVDNNSPIRHGTNRVDSQEHNSHISNGNASYQGNRSTETSHINGRAIDRDIRVNNTWLSFSSMTLNHSQNSNARSSSNRTVNAARPPSARTTKSRRTSSRTSTTADDEDEVLSDLSKKDPNVTEFVIGQSINNSVRLLRRNGTLVLATANNDHNLRFIDLSTLEVIESLRHIGPVNAIEVHPSNNIISTSSDNNYILSYHFRDRFSSYEMRRTINDASFSLSYSECGNFLGVGTQDGYVVMFDVRSSGILGCFSNDGCSAIRKVVFRKTNAVFNSYTKNIDFFSSRDSIQSTHLNSNMKDMHNCVSCEPGMHHKCNLCGNGNIDFTTSCCGDIHPNSFRTYSHTKSDYNFLYSGYNAFGKSARCDDHNTCSKTPFINRTCANNKYYNIKNYSPCCYPSLRTSYNTLNRRNIPEESYQSPDSDLDIPYFENSLTDYTSNSNMLVYTAQADGYGIVDMKTSFLDFKNRQWFNSSQQIPITGACFHDDSFFVATHDGIMQHELLKKGCSNSEVANKL